jgi:hypothetical protein
MGRWARFLHWLGMHRWEVVGVTKHIYVYRCKDCKESCMVKAE